MINLNALVVIFLITSPIPHISVLQEVNAEELNKHIQVP